MRAVFLDLQGTLGGDGLGDVREFEFFPCAIPAVRLINSAGLLAVVITNQSHIGKGMLSYKEYEQRMGAIKQTLVREGGYFDAVYCCPHTQHDGCNCKKPLPGLIRRGVQEFDIDVSRSYVVGDMGASDMVLAHTEGAKGILVLTGVGKGSLGEFRHTWAGIQPAYIAENVLDAVEWILLQETK